MPETKLHNFDSKRSSWSYMISISTFLQLLTEEVTLVTLINYKLGFAWDTKLIKLCYNRNILAVIRGSNNVILETETKNLSL